MLVPVPCCRPNPRLKRRNGFHLVSAWEKDEWGDPLSDFVGDLFSDAGISLAGYEQPFEVAVATDGEVIGASSYGHRWPGTASFSVAVTVDQRRKGVARALVKSILDKHPGEHMEPWVVSGEMAKLLESLGFEWDREGIYMVFDVPGRARRNHKKSWIDAEADVMARTPRERVRSVETTSPQTQALFTGPLLARPGVKLPRTTPATGVWPYGSLDAINARIVAEAVEVFDGNIRAASRALKVSHTTTMRWLNKYRELIDAGGV